MTGYGLQSHRKNQQDATVQQNLLFQCFLIAQHFSGDTPPITRSSKTVIAASGFTYVFGCRPKHVEQLRNIGIINSTTRSRPVGSFCEIYITMHGSVNITDFSLFGDFSVDIFVVVRLERGLEKKQIILDCRVNGCQVFKLHTSQTQTSRLATPLTHVIVNP